jgi:hypothetical protein
VERYGKACRGLFNFFKTDFEIEKNRSWVCSERHCIFSKGVGAKCASLCVLILKSSKLFTELRFLRHRKHYVHCKDQLVTVV